MTTDDRRGILIAALVLLLTSRFGCSFRDNLNEEIHASAGEILRMRGYNAEQHVLKTKEYFLDLIRASNPLIKRRYYQDPLLFVHGLTLSSKGFLIQSSNVQPKDYSWIDVKNSKLKDLEDLLLDDPASMSLVFTALNFGHEVWLINRRPTSFSAKLYAQHHNLSSIDEINARKYWSFSMDEQAAHDLPVTINYCLKVSKSKKLVYIGHSEGGSLALMALSLYPALHKKLSKVILWAPSTHLGAQKPHTNVPLTEIQSVINRAGPFPTIAIWRLEKDLLLKLCTDPVAQHTYCNLLLYFTGSSDKQIVLPGYAGILDLASINELHQHVQSMQKGRTHFFDFNDEAKHMALYGQPKPPAYDLRRIESRSISIWWTYRDTLSKPEAIKATMRDLRVPFEEHVFNNDTQNFGHMSFLIHDELPKLLVIPTMISLRS